MNRKNELKWIILFSLLVFLLMGGDSVLSEEIYLGYEGAQVTKESRGVILIPIEYKEEQWFMGEAGVYILPCDPPTPFVMGEVTGPLVRILDKEGVSVYQIPIPKGFFDDDSNTVTREETEKELQKYIDRDKGGI